MKNIVAFQTNIIMKRLVETQFATNALEIANVDVNVNANAYVFALNAKDVM